MPNSTKFLDTTGLTLYDHNIKGYISERNIAVASALNELSQLIKYLTFTTNANNANSTVDALDNAISQLGGAVIRKTLTGCTISNSASITLIGGSYTASLIRDEETSIFTSISVVMNNVDVTSTSWNANTETINIASVTGSIIITATASTTLPSGYTRLSYVVADGNQEINTGLAENSTSGASYEVMVTAQVYRKGNHILCGKNTYYPLLRTTSGGDNEIGANNRGNETPSNDASKLFNWQLNQKYKIEALPIDPWTVKVDGVTIYQLSRGGSKTTDNLYIFNAHGVTSQDYKFRGRLYSMSIYGNSGELLRRFVPCKNSSDVAGLYDLVGETFYTSDTETALIAGEEI